jgi:hypothetical protein
MARPYERMLEMAQGDQALLLALLRERAARRRLQAVRCREIGSPDMAREFEEDALLYHQAAANRLGGNGGRA